MASKKTNGNKKQDAKAPVSDATSDPADKPAGDPPLTADPKAEPIEAETQVADPGESVEIPSNPDDGVADSPPDDGAGDQTDAAAGAAPGDDAGAGDPPDDQDDDAAPAKPEPEKKGAAGIDKKAADKTRREKLIAEHQEAIAKAPVDEKFEAGEKRKAEIMDRMAELADDVAAHDEEINTLRDESAELLLELYPQQGQSDKLSTTVRAYLNASARERQHRKLAPARLKALLLKAGLAPIDAAYARARGRGMARPIRKPAAKAAAPAADQAKDAKPIKKAE